MQDSTMQNQTETSPLVNPFDANSINTDPRRKSCTPEKKRQAKILGLVGGGIIGASGLAVLLYFVLRKNEENGLITFLNNVVVLPDQNNDGHPIPHSYYAKPPYWQWVCDTVSDCNPNMPLGLDMQTERIDATFGINIYDSGTWQVANAIVGRIEAARHQSAFLISGHTADANPKSVIHALSDLTKTPINTFTYGVNQTYITDMQKAYFFRMLGPSYLNRDPLSGWGPIPKDTYAAWLDWKPITGENAWARLIGPLQTIYLAHGKNIANIDFKSNEIQLAHNSIPAFADMQAPIGCFYYTTTDVTANKGFDFVNPYSVSLENNFSLLAGLNIYRTILANTKVTHFTDGKSVATELAQVNTMIQKCIGFIRTYAYDEDAGYFIQGGLANDPNQHTAWVPTKQPFAVDVQTWGLTVLGQPFIDRTFGAGTAYKIWQNTKQIAGYYPDSDTSKPIGGVGYSNKPKPISGPSFNITATNLDGNKNNQYTLTAVALWEEEYPPTVLKTDIAYGSTVTVTVPTSYEGKTGLAGIQFIDKNNHEVVQLPLRGITGELNFNAGTHLTVGWKNVGIQINKYAPRHDILSSEWTFGAIGMTLTLTTQYQSANQTSIAQALLQDYHAMKATVQSLRASEYPLHFKHVPKSALVTLPAGDAFLYSNKRYAIPFGWYANPIPSTAGTAWAVMIEQGYNPFQLGGSQQATDWYSSNFTFSSNSNPLRPPFYGVIRGTIVTIGLLRQGCQQLAEMLYDRFTADKAPTAQSTTNDIFYPQTTIVTVVKHTTTHDVDTGAPIITHHFIDPMTHQTGAYSTYGQADLCHYANDQATNFLFSTDDRIHPVAVNLPECDPNTPRIPTLTDRLWIDTKTMGLMVIPSAVIGRIAEHRCDNPLDASLLREAATVITLITMLGTENSYATGAAVASELALFIAEHSSIPHKLGISPRVLNTLRLGVMALASGPSSLLRFVSRFGAGLVLTKTSTTLVDVTHWLFFGKPQLLPQKTIEPHHHLIRTLRKIVYSNNPNFATPTVSSIKNKLSAAFKFIMNARHNDGISKSDLSSLENQLQQVWETCSQDVNIMQTLHSYLGTLSCENKEIFSQALPITNLTQSTHTPR